jgi:hypothetical protein
MFSYGPRYEITQLLSHSLAVLGEQFHGVRVRIRRSPPVLVSFLYPRLWLGL